MANLVNYVKTVWENGKTALNAARMNNMEKGISDCATQINKLGDSVSRLTVIDDAGSFFIGWDANGPYVAVRNRDNSQQVSLRLSDAGNGNRPSTTQIDLNSNKANSIWAAQ